MDSGDGIETERVTGDRERKAAGAVDGSQAGPPQPVPVTRVQAVKDAALVPKMTSQNWSTVAKVFERGIVSSTNTHAKTVSFIIGATAGFVIAVGLGILLAHVYPLTAPFAFMYLVLPLTIAGGIIGSRVLPRKDIFTNDEQLRLEQAQYVLKAKSEALDLREGQMRQNGIPGPDIEVALGPERQRAQDEYFRVLDELRGGDAARKALGDGS